MRDALEAPRPAVRSALASVIVVLLAVGGSTAEARRADDTAAADKAVVVVDRPEPTEVAAPPVVPEAVRATPEPVGTPVPVATMQTVVGAADEPFVPVDSTTRAAVTVAVDDTSEAVAREVLDGLDGVVHVARVQLVTTTLGGVEADVAGVDPDEFRPFTPEATADHEPLWSRIEAGDVAVTHEFGTVHEVELGSMLGVGAVQTPIRVGAFATNGTPPVADAIVHADQLSTLPVTGASARLLVGLEDEASPTATVEALEDAGLEAEEVPDPRLPNSQTIVPPAGITPENVWDHLAMCESSGDWHINTGNGYYGGIQFLPESWAWVGGTGLPHEHTREEQIYRGTLLWQIQGWEAWPQCARKLGLIVDAPSES
ncbi:transglycosylase family protein [Euzebya rosea]|uniref:transglycosylase family protein n=1 Tax=Euzebya rosea TaxID=2052804 RepID=UPI0023E89058|nr:transglycosylase family protein [Euzebya rosea]